MKQAFKLVGYWVGHFIAYTAAILAVGTVVGTLVFLLIGKFFGDYSWMFLMKKGAWVGFRYAGVWAGGVAIIFCFIKGARRKAAL